MREIKFRAWDLQKKKWIEEGTTFVSAEISSGQLGISLDGHLRVFLPHCYEEKDEEFPELQHNVSNSEYESVHPVETKPSYKRQYELIQFTGLKDKNGKEIYEGDIVKIFNRHEKVEFKEEGISTDPGSGYTMVWGWFFGDEPLNDTNLENLEVIGNIYENPELLK